ncbi:MAG: hypothetical protein RLP14_10345 [Owenweeksia sp.]
MGQFDRYVDKDGLTKTTRETFSKGPGGYSVGKKKTGTATQTKRYLRESQ